MEDSILKSVKKLLGIPDEYTEFDTDIIMHINSVMPKLAQLGVGPKDGFLVNDDTTTWSDLIGDCKLLNNVKSFTYLSVRMLFDPPTTSISMDALKQNINEIEFRIGVAVDEIRKKQENGGEDND